MGEQYFLEFINFIKDLFDYLMSTQIGKGLIVGLIILITISVFPNSTGKSNKNENENDKQET